MVQQTKQELRIPASRHIGMLLYVLALMLAWMLCKERGWPMSALVLWLSLAFCSIPSESSLPALSPRGNH